MLDYSRLSRHILVTAGDDGSAHLWDITGHSPKVWKILPNLSAYYKNENEILLGYLLV